MGYLVHDQDLVDYLHQNLHLYCYDLLHLVRQLNLPFHSLYNNGNKHKARGISSGYLISVDPSYRVTY